MNLSKPGSPQKLQHAVPDTIDLNQFDLPHAGSSIEWWYVNAHLQNEKHEEFALFASFFKLAVGKDATTGKLQFAYSLTWALSDLKSRAYYRDSLLDPCAPAVGLETLNKGKLTSDKRMQAALKEVLEQNQIPLPDRLAVNSAEVDWEEFNIQFEGNTIAAQADGSYQVLLVDKEKSVSLDLIFHPQIAPVKHGDNGQVLGTGGEDMFYYFIPHNAVHGSLQLQGEKHNLSGSGWYDHEFALEKESTEAEVEVNLLHDIGWNWVSLQLNNGYQLTAYDLYDRGDHAKSEGRWAVLIGPDGTAEYPTVFEFVPVEFWTSSKTFMEYPVKWCLNVPSHQIELELKASFPEQEFISMLSEPAFWEGRIDAQGSMKKKPVKGKAYIEVSGYNATHTMEHFLKAVTKATRKAVNVVLPKEPSDEKFISMVASMKNSHFLEGLSKAQFVEQVVLPIREIIDRGGKSWRSYAALACIDLVGGNSQPYLNWLAWPELLHTGSLIIDDIQDQSSIRRGGISCHEQHGVAIAINAGNAAYFIGQPLLLDNSISDAKKLKLYEVYFETMRAAHAGQAMDISSFQSLMDEVAVHGNADELVKKVLSVHRLKSAVPAAMLARLGAIMGDAEMESEDRLSNFFESLGLAFQIMDDVLNLKGFEQGLKDKGEDIRAGKITVPLVLSMERLNADDRRDLWKGVKEKPSNHDRIGELIQVMDKCGALKASEDLAESLVDKAWFELQRSIKPSMTSVKLRAFSWFVLNRHY